jgi:Zn-dependent protease
MSENVVARIVTIALWAVPVLFSIIVHEVAHGWIANRLGDDTAKRMGRLTLNPISHIDPIGTIILPAFMIIIGGPVFGWAKPVPFNPNNFKRNIDPRNGVVWVALAGPSSNLLIAFVTSFIYVAALKLFSPLPYLTYFIVMNVAQALISVNLMLGCFNLIPIPPLDGSKILMRFLPRKYAYYLLEFERYGFLVLAILLATGSLSSVIEVPMRYLLRLFLLIPNLLFGNG